MKRAEGKYHTVFMRLAFNAIARRDAICKVITYTPRGPTHTVRSLFPLLFAIMTIRLRGQAQTQLRA